MTARETYNTTVASSETTKAATIATAEVTKQETINGSGINAGYHPGVGSTSSASYESAVKSANQAKWDSIFKAEQTKQASVAAARDTLRNAGTDNGAF